MIRKKWIISFKKTNSNRVGSLCTDGVSSTLSEVKFYNASEHCTSFLPLVFFIDMHSASKSLPEYLKIVLKYATERVKFIRSWHGLVFSKCLMKMSQLIFNVKQNAVFKIHILRLWLFQMWVWIGRRVSNAVEPRIWSYHTFPKYLPVWGRVLRSDDHKTKHWSRLITKDDMRVPFSHTVPRISNIVRRKQSTKVSLSDWLFEIVCHFV